MRGVKNMKRWISFLVLLILGYLLVFLIPSGTSTGLSGQAAAEMAAANSLYEQGSFEEAAQAYQSLVNQGYNDSSLFYNLGNAYYKIGQNGKALLYYRKAETLAPRDADIQANLNLARSQTQDQFESGGQAFYSRLVLLSRSWLTINEMSLLALGLWFLLVLLLITRTVFTPGTRLQEGLTYALLVVAVLFVFSGATFGSRLYLDKNRPSAVVIAEEISVNSGPGEQFITEFSLHSGAEVSVLEQRNNWSRLTLPGNDLQGWVPDESLGLVRE